MEAVAIYDKASYHYEGNYPSGLPSEHALTHMGFYIRWLREKDLLNADGADLSGPDYSGISARDLARRFDGVLSSEVMTNKGREFSDSYYAKGLYFEDYAEFLAGPYPTIYHVADTEANYAVLKKVLDDRLDVAAVPAHRPAPPSGQQ
jgi:hypothetical protein